MIDIEERFEDLTPRETEVYSLLLSPLLLEEIADRLSVSINTLKAHNANIYGKLLSDTSLHYGRQTLTVIELCRLAPEKYPLGWWDLYYEERSNGDGP